MSTNRSNSQVRNLRAMFENNAPPSRTSIESSSPERGRSNGHLSPGPNGERPLSRVRSSFVSVEPTITMEKEIDPEKTKQEYGARHESTASFRRESFSLDELGDSGAIAELKKTISRESERRSSNPSVAETIPEAAIEATPAATTPAVEAKDYMAAGQLTSNDKGQPLSKLRDVITPGVTPGAVAGTKEEAESEPAGGAAAQTEPETQTQTAADDDLPADNPDKPVSGLQGEPGPMQPSDLKDRAAVSPVASPAPAPAPEQTETETDTEAKDQEQEQEQEQEKEKEKDQDQPVPVAASPAAASASAPAPAPAPAPAQQTPRARRGTLSVVDVPGAASSSTVPVAVDPPTSVSAPHTDAAAAQKTPSPKRPSNINVKSPDASVKQQQQQQPKTPTSVKKAPSSAKPSPASSVLSPKPSAKNLAAAASKGNSPQSKPVRQRSPTRPAKLPSHLIAPTASSAAKHDAHSAKPSTAALKPAPATKPASTTKPAPTTRTQPRASSATSKSTPRSSVAPTTAAPKKPEPRPAAASTKGPDDSFLARMMRPTASSASKVHDRTEVKSPPKRTPSVVRAKAAVKPKTAKIEKPATNGSKPSSSSSSKETKPETTEAPKTESQHAGASTPQASSGAQDQPPTSDANLQATPAFDTATIR